MANTDHSNIDNIPSPASGPALRPELDMAALIADATAPTPRSPDEIKTGTLILLNGQGGLWWA